MRPGPGLVVMALAFISGARRGSTSTSTNSKVSSTSYSTTSTANSVTATPQQQQQPSLSTSKTQSVPIAAQFFLTFFDQGAALQGRQQQTQAKSNQPYNSEQSTHPLFVLPTHLRAYYDRTAKSALSSATIRRARSISEDSSGDDLVGGAGGGIPLASFGSEASDTSSNSVESAGGEGVVGAGGSGGGGGGGDGGVGENGYSSEGLVVHFPSHVADSSTSFDEDDILALVAEDDLLSEESFDRLTKLTDNKINYINEEDYSGTESGVDSVGSSESHTFSESRNEAPTSQALRLEQDTKHAPAHTYAANLVSNNNDITANAEEHTLSAAFSWSLVAETHNQNSEEQNFDLRRSIIESASPLTRLNPWISACDLAQPGTAPDLQVSQPTTVN